MVVFFRECPQLKLFYEENSRSGRGISFGRWPRGWEDFVKYFPRDGMFILFTPETSSMRTLFFHLTTPLVTKVMCSLVRLFIPLVSLRAFANLFTMTMEKKTTIESNSVRSCKLKCWNSHEIFWKLIIYSTVLLPFPLYFFRYLLFFGCATIFIKSVGHPKGDYIMWNTTNQMFKNCILIKSMEDNSRVNIFCDIRETINLRICRYICRHFSINIAIVFNALDDFMKRILWKILPREL